MRRISLLITAIYIFASNIQAQNEVDALRYSRHIPAGTARSIALGGAVGALGADFTSLSINPAGIALYRSSEFTISPSLFIDNTNSLFLGNTNEATNYNFNLGNIGFVNTFNTSNETSGWISTNFGFGYNRLANFNRNIVMSGINNSSSLLDNFTNFAQGTPSNQLNEYYEGLAYDVMLLPYDTITNEYWNDLNEGGYGQLQRRRLNTSGSIGEYTFSFGANYSHRLYLGATFGISRVNYRQDITHLEDDEQNSIPFFDRFVFMENLRTSGTGYSLKLGAIVRPINPLRIGFAFHLPYFYNLNDRWTTDMDAYFDPAENIDPQSAASPLGEYSYKLRTPSKMIGSAAMTIGKLGLLTAEYERVDYTKANLNANDYEFIDENDMIKSTYQATHNLKFGAELRFGPAYFRGGYAFYQTPFAISEPNVNKDLNIISAGFGIRGQSIYIDFGYANNRSEEVYYMYRPEMNQQGSVNSLDSHNIIMTLGYKF
jgi:hypothetical protein